MRLPHTTVAQRVTFAFVLMILLVLIGTGTGLLFSQSFAESNDASAHAFDQLRAASRLEIAWYQVIASVDYMLLTRQTNLIEGRLGEQIAAFNERVAAMQAEPPGSTPEGVAAASASLTTLAALVEDLNLTITELFELAQAANWTRAQAHRHTELAALQRRFSEGLADLQDTIEADADAAIAEAVSLLKRTQRSWISVSLAAVVVGAVAAFIVASSIIRPVASLVKVAQAIQSGDFSREASSTGPQELSVMAHAFNDMTGKLHVSIESLERNVSELEISNRERDRLIVELRDALLFKDQFLATMSHELRTPLNAMMGYAALIQDEELDEDVRYMIQRIEGNSSRLLNLINDVLNIARINANRVEILSRPIDLTSMVKSWHSDFKHTADEKGLQFDVEVDPALPAVIMGDEERLTQIAANLLQNAFKFTGSGFVRLQVRRQQNEWQIIVSDSGQGIPETWQHLIFDEFRQVDSGSKRKHGGAGLGLSIVKKLCLLMGGSVSVSSKLESGSTFTVNFPLRTGVTLEQSQPSAEKAQEEYTNVADPAVT